ncbi:uncharacterized protein LOC144860385 [Branchiostoma floridae x Branchiostoma japonicum]
MQATMAATLASFEGQIYEELTCSICLQLPTKPKVLPCQHTFCQDCLKKVAGQKSTFPCPDCHQQVRLPPEGIKDLPDNQLVTSLCERLQNSTTSSGKNKQQPQSGKCSVHPSEDVKLYCKQCKVPVCDECLDRSHSGHTTMKLKKASQDWMSTVQPLITEGSDILGTQCNFLKSLGEKEKTLQKQKLQTENSIEYDFDKMVQKLKERRDQLLCQVEENHKKNINILQEERNSILSDISKLYTACDQAEQDMGLGGRMLYSFGSSLFHTVGKYRGKAAPAPVPTQSTIFYSTYTPVPVLGHVAVPVVFGGEGAGIGQFSCPTGVTVSEKGEVFVADRENYRIQVFTLQGMFVQEFQRASYNRQIMSPNDVAMDGEGNLWVVGYTEFAHVAVQYSKLGRVLRTFDLQDTKWVKCVAVDTRRNHILITQSTGHTGNTQGEVQVFRPDGTLVKTVGRQQCMKHPRYITLDRKGDILVSDSYMHCVFVYDKDGQFVFKFGGEGKREGQLNKPLGICTDRKGNIIVADSMNDRVEMFDKTGRFLKHVATDIKRPHAVAMAPKGQLVVTSVDKHTIQIIHCY